MANPLSMIAQSGDDAQVVKSLCRQMGITPEEALAKGLINDKGLFFTKTGKEVKTAIASKITKLKSELSDMGYCPESFKKLAPKNVEGMEEPAIGGTAEVVMLPGDAPTEEDAAPWEVRSRQCQITRLSLFLRNIDPSKKFTLSQYDLEEYGF